MTKISRSLCWKLNWYRQSELDGALLLGKAVRFADDPKLIAALTHHAADEARHASLWAETMSRLECPWLRVLRSYQSYYGEHGVMPTTLTEVLALTHVFERRVWRQFHGELAQPDWPALARDTFAQLLDDERQHLEWIDDHLAGVPQADALLAQYAEIDKRVYEHLRPYENCLWELPGLGVELETATTAHEHAVGKHV